MFSAISAASMSAAAMLAGLRGREAPTLGGGGRPQLDRDGSVVGGIVVP
jgi:hypothetical protein